MTFFLRPVRRLRSKNKKKGQTIEFADKGHPGDAIFWWRCEVRQNETTEASQPWHWVVWPIGLKLRGARFLFKNLANDFAKDKVGEFIF